MGGEERRPILNHLVGYAAWFVVLPARLHGHLVPHVDVNGHSWDGRISAGKASVDLAGC